MVWHSAGLAGTYQLPVTNQHRSYNVLDHDVRSPLTRVEEEGNGSRHWRLLEADRAAHTTPHCRSRRLAVQSIPAWLELRIFRRTRCGAGVGLASKRFLLL